MPGASDLVGRFTTYLINPAMLLVFAAGFFFFVYGLVEFLWKLNQGGENEEGKRHMIWGIVGMLVMVSWYSILALVTGTFGFTPESGANNPTLPSINNTSPFQ